MKANNTLPTLRLRMSVDPDMGEFYHWCVQKKGRVRAREVLTAARHHVDKLLAQEAAPAGSMPPPAPAPAPAPAQAPAPALAPSAPNGNAEPREPNAVAAGLGRRFVVAKPSKDDNG